MPTTIRDIAREAGVSTATVSKVINNKMYVAPATREKVLQIMKDLNYSPNVSASKQFVYYPEAGKTDIAI